MISPIRLIAAAGALAALTGCGSDMEDAVTPAVASDERFETMTDPCLEQAARFSGQPLNNITVTGQSMTGGGPRHIGLKCPDPLVVQGLLSMLDKAVVVEVRGNPEYVVKHRLMVDGCVTASLVPNYVAHVSVAKPRPLIESRELAGIVRVHEGLVLGDELHARPRWRLRV